MWFHASIMLSCPWRKYMIELSCCCRLIVWSLFLPVKTTQSLIGLVPKSNSKRIRRVFRQIRVSMFNRTSTMWPNLIWARLSPYNLTLIKTLRRQVLTLPSLKTIILWQDLSHAQALVKVSQCQAHRSKIRKLATHRWETTASMRVKVANRPLKPTVSLRSRCLTLQSKFWMNYRQNWSKMSGQCKMYSANPRKSLK